MFIIEKNNIKFLLNSIWIISTLTFSTSHSTQIDDLYKNISGFGINKEETNFILNNGGDPTYGEITYEGTKELFKYLKPRKKDVFYDLGCGVGKVVVQALLETPIKKSVGVELSETRLKSAESVKKELAAKNKFITKNHNLEFRKEDITKTDLKDATIVYICSTCFSDNLMKNLTNKLAGLKKGLRVATLRKLAPNKKFKLEKELKLPMTWSSSSSVYIYKKI